MRADPVPDRSPLIARLGAPSPPEGPASAPPSGALLPTLSNAIDLPRRQRMSRECRRARRNPAFRFPANLAQAAHTNPAVLSPLPPLVPLDLIDPPRLAPSWLLR